MMKMILNLVICFYKAKLSTTPPTPSLSSLSYSNLLPVSVFMSVFSTVVVVVVVVAVVVV